MLTLSFWLNCFWFSPKLEIFNHFKLYNVYFAILSYKLGKWYTGSWEFKYYKCMPFGSCLPSVDLPCSGQCLRSLFVVVPGGFIVNIPGFLGLGALNLSYQTKLLQYYILLQLVVISGKDPQRTCGVLVQLHTVVLFRVQHNAHGLQSNSA